MASRAPIALALAAMLALPAATAGKPSESQTFFSKALLKDAKTTNAVKKMLRTGGGFIDPRSGFVDVTGDGRSDALVFVTTGGVAGGVAFYVFSTHGRKLEPGKETPLKVVYRNQSLYRATVRLHETTITLVTPQYAKGDDACCPQKLFERDYVWTEADSTFRSVATREVPGPGVPAPPAAG